MKIFGIIGWQNSGKTTLIEALVKDFTRRGLLVSTIKHTHHDVETDAPGKDSFRHRAAGAKETVLAGPHRFALIHEYRANALSLRDILAQMTQVDLVLIEGFKTSPHPKIEVYRREISRTIIQPTDPTIRAVATDTDLGILSVRCLNLNNPVAIADFILGETGLGPV